MNAGTGLNFRPLYTDRAQNDAHSVSIRFLSACHIEKYFNFWTNGTVAKRVQHRSLGVFLTVRYGIKENRMAMTMKTVVSWDVEPCSTGDGDDVSEELAAIATFNAGVYAREEPGYGLARVDYFVNLPSLYECLDSTTKCFIASSQALAYSPFIITLCTSSARRPM